MTNNPTEQFIRMFERIVAEVNRRAGRPSSHSFEIEEASRHDTSIRKNRALLMYIRDVRNALQHPKHNSEGHAVQVTKAFLDEVRRLLNYLIKPPTANSVGVTRKQIKTAGLNDPLGDLADIMKERAFSHLPILDERDAVIGVFNEAAVFDHLWAEAETIISRQMQVSDILPHCHLDASHTENFAFVMPGTPIDDLIEMFVAIDSPATRVGAAFVTVTGKKSDALQRMITPWDVLAVSGK